MCCASAGSNWKNEIVQNVAPIEFVEQPLLPWRRAVLKVGSSLLAADGQGLTARYARPLADFVEVCHAQGRQVTIVSSGAVAAGRGVLGAASRPSAPNALALRQAMAALGQAPMVALWQGLVARPVAQVLLTHDDLRHRRRYLNAQATLRELLRLGALPVVNENDTVAVDELKVGDNDNLAAIVAALVDADVLLIATDTGGLYSANPRLDPAARPVQEVTSITPDIVAMAAGVGTALGTGGMQTKLEAATKAIAAGIETVLFDGRDADVLAGLALDRLRGTRIRANATRLQARKYWLRHAPAAAGAIRIDDGAAHALSAGGASLLPRGVVAAEGDFGRGDFVEVYCASAGRSAAIARGIVQYSAAEVRRIAGNHSRDIEPLLGYSYGENIMHRDDLVCLVTQVPA
jgi:glutamate 5-kinase